MINSCTTNNGFRYLQIREAQTVRAIFQDNSTLCNEVNEKVIQHFVHCIETHGKHVQYLRFLQTIVRAENSFIRKCQDMVMQEVCAVCPFVLSVVENCSYRSDSFVFLMCEAYSLLGLTVRCKILFFFQCFSATTTKTIT